VTLLGKRIMKAERQKGRKAEGGKLKAERQKGGKAES
jgi:hypothetical protein